MTNCPHVFAPCDECSGDCSKAATERAIELTNNTKSELVKLNTTFNKAVLMALAFALLGSACYIGAMKDQRAFIEARV